MNLHIFGAAGEVTGSCYLLTTERAQVLIDCGMFQDADVDRLRNRIPHDLDAGQFDAVVLTHAHLDHSGRLPLLARSGATGPIYATPATIDVVALLLADAAKLQQSDAERANRTRERAGRAPIAPLFDEADVAALLPLFRPLPLEQEAAIAPGVTLRFVEAGHILGSASVVLTVREGEATRTLVFSGDIGPRGTPILNDPAQLALAADLVVLESTYGDRDHRSLESTVAELADLVREAVRRRSKLIIPAFAVGRSQEILYHLAALIRADAIPALPIYLDSPLAIKATELYKRYPGLADAESLAVRDEHGLWRGLETLQFCATSAQSRALNRESGPCIIIAGAGMCNGGRVLHHFKHTLWRPETLVVIVGYQAAGTLGRLLVESARRVNIMGESIAVRAQIHTLGGFSAHAGQRELLAWLAPLTAKRPQIVLTHGEEPARIALAAKIADQFGLTAELPLLGDLITLAV